MRQVPPLDAVWLVLESRDTPMHVGGLFEFTLPDDAPADYLRQEVERMREAHSIPAPWNLKLVEGPLVGPRVPLMREIRDVDLDYHVRHSALPHPGGQREHCARKNEPSHHSLLRVLRAGLGDCSHKIEIGVGVPRAMTIVPRGA